MARLRRAGHEAAGLEGVSPALRAWASNFSLRGQRKVTKRKAIPAYSPDFVGFLRLTRLSHGTRRRAVHGPAPLARHPVSRPGQAGSPQRIRGGNQVVPILSLRVGGQIPSYLCSCQRVGASMPLHLLLLKLVK
jgi:hypothetical protein